MWHFSVYFLVLPRKVQPNTLSIPLAHEKSPSAPLLRRSPFQLQALKYSLLCLLHCLWRAPPAILQIYPIVRTLTRPNSTTIKLEASVFAIPAQVPLKGSFRAPTQNGTSCRLPGTDQNVHAAMWVGILGGGRRSFEFGVLPDCEGFIKSVETCAPRPARLEAGRSLAPL